MARKVSYKDPAGDMAKAQLQKIEMYAAKLNDMIHPDDELESWVQSKLSRISTDIGDVKHYLDYELKKMAKGGTTGMEDMKVFNVGFKYEMDTKDGEDEDIVRIVKVHANSKEEAEKIAEDKYSPYFDDFEIVKIEQMKYGGEVSASEMLEARNVVGEDLWKTMTRAERYSVTEYLINKGYVEEEDELMGMQPEISSMELSSMLFKKGGELEEEDEYRYEREGIEHEMLEYDYKQMSGQPAPMWFVQMPLNYKRVIINSMQRGVDPTKRRNRFNV
jgi:hypothetical protein